MSQVDDQKWRGQVDTDIRGISAGLSRLETKQEATDEKIDSTNATLRTISGKIDHLAQGPELWRYGTIAIGTISVAWFLVQTYTTSAVKDALMADLKQTIEIDARMDLLDQRLTINEEATARNRDSYRFQWDDAEKARDQQEGRDRERIASLEGRHNQRFERNEVVLERLRSAREDDNDLLRESAVADKDELERARMDDLRDAIRRLETAMGHLRAQFSENLPGGDD